MGRKKIAIERIPDNRNRQITFMKRKLGLFRKAYQLSVLCDCQISVIIMPKNNKLFQYSSTDMNGILQKYVSHPHPDEALTNEDMSKKLKTMTFTGSDNEDVETPVQDMHYNGTMFSNQVILDQQPYKPTLDQRLMYSRAMVDHGKQQQQQQQQQQHLQQQIQQQQFQHQQRIPFPDSILQQTLPVALQSNFDGSSPKSIQSNTDISSISSPPPRDEKLALTLSLEVNNQKSQRLRVIESGNLSLTLPMAPKIQSNTKIGKVVAKPLRVVVPNTKGVTMTTTVGKVPTTHTEALNQPMIMANSHLHTPNINMQTPRDMVFTNDNIDLFGPATYTPFGLGINTFAAHEDRDISTIPLSRIDVQKHIKLDPDNLDPSTPEDPDYQSADEDDSPLDNQEPDGSNSDFIQIPDIAFNGQTTNSGGRPITHSLLGPVHLSEALGHASGDTIMSPISHDQLLTELSPGHNTDTMPNDLRLNAALSTPARRGKKTPLPGINDSTRSALQTKLNSNSVINGTHSLIAPSHQQGNPTLSFMNPQHLQMNYYQHFPQITQGLGAAFYSPSEYLNKPPSEFPIGSIRLIDPSLLRQQQQQTLLADTDLSDIANMQSPASSIDYAELDVNNKRSIEQSSVDELNIETIPMKKQHLLQ